MSVTKVISFVRRFANDKSGISAVEYGLLAAGIAVGLWVFIGGDGGIGPSLESVFEGVADSLSDISS